MLQKSELVKLCVGSGFFATQSSFKQGKQAGSPAKPQQ
jgi:hypothetical protein